MGSRDVCSVYQSCCNCLSDQISKHCTPSLRFLQGACFRGSTRWCQKWQIVCRILRGWLAHNWHIWHQLKARKGGLTKLVEFWHSHAIQPLKATHMHHKTFQCDCFCAPQFGVIVIWSTSSRTGWVILSQYWFGWFNWLSMLQLKD